MSRTNAHISSSEWRWRCSCSTGTGTTLVKLCICNFVSTICQFSGLLDNWVSDSNLRILCNFRSDTFTSGSNPLFQAGE
uniref:Uncharacterized protein n=1 Tax=Setaria italica TaxID=4555 RepID=K3ZBD2_SETIT